MKNRTLIHRIILGVLAAIFLVANVAMTISFDYLTKVTNNLGLDLDNEEAEAVRKEALEFTKKITEEGIVLLRNENEALPLKSGTKINLFGWSTTQMITGGSGGSGGVSAATVNIKSSLEDAGFEVNEELYNMYSSYKAARDIVPEEKYGGYSPSWETPEPAITDKKYYTEELLQSAKEFSDVAIFTVSRTSGEGLDIPEGYLSLDQEEKDAISYLKENYKKVIVLINSNSAVELKYLEEIQVDATIFMPGVGDVGAASLGKILSGKVNPSGHLVDTFAYDHKSAPNYYYANRPGTMEYSDLEGYFYVDYVEGIYVGYKYYETAAYEEYINYEDTVQYPFGYGLSYTTFEKKVVSTSGDLNKKEKIEIQVNVKNTGKVAGKEVVQIYVTPEYYQGGIEKAYVDLVGFEKTGLLEPGQSEMVTVTIDPLEIASYDWNDANADGKTGYVLEKGKYELKLMENSHYLKEIAQTYDITENIYIENDPYTGTKITNLFDDVAGEQETENVQYLSRSDFTRTFPEEKNSNTGRAASQEVKDAREIAYEDDPDDKAVITGADNGLSVEDIKDVDFDDPAWDKLLDQMTLEEMENLITNGAFTTPEIKSIGLKSSVHADGPQGISAWFLKIYGTSYPVQLYVGQTWNQELASEQGEMFAREARASNVSAMYAPAVNIHRTPYSGRNFEYYSEDGFLSGKMAAKVTYAAREEGVFMFVKHFALNDQETYRGEYYTSLFTWANEQSMREVYLKPFEIAVKEGKTTALMSSFNRVGATWTGASKALCTDLLRTEWGFKGTIITDLYVSMNNEWWMSAEQGIRAGNDLWLQLFGAPGSLEIDETNPTAQRAMRESAKHVIYTISQGSVSPKAPQADWFYYIALPVDIMWVLGMILYGVFIFRKTKKNKDEK